MPPESLPKEKFRFVPAGGGPGKNPGHSDWRGHVSLIAWEHLGILPKDLESHVDSLHNPAPNKQLMMDGQMDGYYIILSYIK